MKKRMALMLVLAILVLGGIFGFKIFQGMMMKKYMASAGAPAQTVSVASAQIQDWQPSLTAVGSVRAVKGADLSAEVSGIVEAIKFESGGDADAGAVLVQLRAEDDVAKLHALEAAASLAQITYERDSKQLKIKAVSQATVDSDAAALAADAAQVAEQKAVVEKKTIRAPFAGHIGIRKVDIGQYLNPGDAIVTLQQLDPIYIDFTLPEAALSQISVGQKISTKIDARPDQAFEGEISAINAKVDEATRNIEVRGSFKNTDHLLLPGMYARVTVETGTPAKYVTLPQTAITFNPYGNTVYLVDNTDKEKPVAKQVFVKTGETRGDQIVILSGVSEGDTVVTAGQIKLRNDAPLKIDNEITPANDAGPKPEDR